MKRFLILLLALVSAAVLLTACGGNADEPALDSGSLSEDDPTSEVPSSETPSVEEPSSEEPVSEEPSTDGPAPVEPEPFDPDVFLTRVCEEHPDTSPEELCGILLEDPYFCLYRTIGTDYGINGIEGSVSGYASVSGIAHYSTDSVLYVFELNAGTDAAAFAEDIRGRAVPDWNWLGETAETDSVFSKVIGGKVFYFLYHANMEPIREAAHAPSDVKTLFHSYCASHPDADCASIASYLISHQDFNTLVRLPVQAGGRLRGIGTYEEPAEVTGYTDVASLGVQIEPGSFLGYVFRVGGETDPTEFASYVLSKADQNYNVCTWVNTAFTETDGAYVLFVLCDE
ncbi:MAG: hypothetical protein J5938_04855 [Clostridia bacterium]|nr:hypothetical protein [Clostridia bacterium]